MIIKFLRKWLRKQIKEEQNMASQALLDQLSTLQAEVAANTSATQSAEALINGFAAQLTTAVAAASDDSAAVAAVQDIVAHFKANDTALARAVAANTPAGPDTPVPPIAAPPEPEQKPEGA